MQDVAGAGAEQPRAGGRSLLDPTRLCGALLAGAVLLLAVRSQHTFLTDPPVWPDEALFAAPAVDLLQNGTFRTRVLEGLLTSAEHGTYWIPPTYPFVLAGAFALFSSSVEVMRAFSVACALGVLLLTYALARRLQPSRALALLAPAWLALDPVFGRGARVGRMDMLALLCVLAAVLVALDRTPTRRKTLLAGLLAGLGVTVHPIAVVALPVVLLAAALREREQRALGSATIGMLLGTLPWTLWIARSPLAFVVQWAGQLIRKRENWEAYGASPWSAALEFTFTRYPPGFHGVVPWLYLAALAGFAFASRRQREARPLLALSVLLGVAVLRAAEMWYTLYLTPLLPLGLLAAVAALPLAGVDGARSQRARSVGLAVAGISTATFVTLSAGDAAEALRWRPAGADYRTWSARVVALIPRNAQVLIAAAPDPYFATLGRPDLTVREFLPPGIPFPADASDALLRDTDVIVLGRVAPSPWVLKALRTRGRSIATVGRPDDVCYGRIFVLAR